MKTLCALAIAVATLVSGCVGTQTAPVVQTTEPVVTETPEEWTDVAKRVDVMPTFVDCPDPSPEAQIRCLIQLTEQVRYPESARQARITGRVNIAFVVDENGAIAGSWVARGAGHPDLDAEALRVVRTAKFNPGLQDGKPTKVLMQIPIQFKLGGFRP